MMMFVPSSDWPEKVTQRTCYSSCPYALYVCRAWLQLRPPKSRSSGKKQVYEEVAGIKGIPLR